MAPVSPTPCAPQPASAFVLPTMPTPSATAAHLATTGILTVLVSRRDPSGSHSGERDEPRGAPFSWEPCHCCYEGSRAASSRDCAARSSLFSHSPLSNHVVDVPCDRCATVLRKLQREIHVDSFLLGSRRPQNRRLGIRFWKPLGAIHCVLAWYSLYPSGTAMELLFTVVSCQQPATAHSKARMETRATRCRASACVSQGWWANSVTTAPLDSGSPTAQVSIANNHYWNVFVSDLHNCLIYANERVHFVF